ncbi:magnesium transporter [Pyrococcus yayanosii]|uniref:Magnesium transporter n=1 Tax=Pyrococcus yayanosii (strain CH1 / JCM 16557) TaxID=529709 RepID=F8AG24_PYRYC|nr:magnesium transporter [Pyrococcus yayanosii]AEH25078.1 magnesium transporter [Pyrococcus yayanosii CH1]
MAVCGAGATREVKEVLREAVVVSLPALLLCLFLDFFAGAFLGKFYEKIRLEYPIILVILPGLMGLRGNIFGALASRFATMLHLGEMTPTLRDENVTKNILISLLLSLLPVTILWLVGVLKVGNANVAVAVFLIVSASTIFASLIIGYSTALATLIPFRKGADPDAVAAPLVTTIGDLVTVPLLVAFMILYERSTGFFGGLFLAGLALVLLLWRHSRIGRDDIRTFFEVMGVVAILALVSSITGSLLQSYSDVIGATVIFSVMYIPILAATGNFGSIIGAKTSTRLHLGEIEGLFNRDVLLEISVYTLLAGLIGLLANVIAIGVVRSALKETVGLVSKFLIFYPLLVFGVMWMAYFMALWFERLGLDPDNATVPAITTLADVFSTLFIILVARSMV